MSSPPEALPFSLSPYILPTQTQQELVVVMSHDARSENATGEAAGAVPSPDSQLMETDVPAALPAAAADAAEELSEPCCACKAGCDTPKCECRRENQQCCLPDGPVCRVKKCANKFGDASTMATGPRRAFSTSDAKSSSGAAVVQVAIIASPARVRKPKGANKSAAGSALVVPSLLVSPVRVSLQSLSLWASSPDKQKPESKEQELEREAQEELLLMTSRVSRDELGAHLRATDEPIHPTARLAAATLVEQHDALEREVKQVRVTNIEMAKKIAALSSREVDLEQENKKLREEKAKSTAATSSSSSPSSRASNSASKKRRGSPPLPKDSPPAKKKTQAQPRVRAVVPAPTPTVICIAPSLVHPERQNQVPSSSSGGPTIVHSNNRRVDAPSTHALIALNVGLRHFTDVQVAKTIIFQRLVNLNLIRTEEDDDSTTPMWVDLMRRRNNNVGRDQMRWKVTFASAEAATLILQRASTTLSGESGEIQLLPYGPTRDEAQDPAQQQRHAQNIRESALAPRFNPQRVLPRDIRVDLQDGERNTRMLPRELFGGPRAKPERDHNMASEVETTPLRPLTPPSNSRRNLHLERPAAAAVRQQTEPRPAAGPSLQPQWMLAAQQFSSPSMMMPPVHVQHQFASQLHDPPSMHFAPEAMQHQQHQQQHPAPYYQSPQSYAGPYSGRAAVHYPHPPRPGPMHPQHGPYAPPQLYDAYGYPVYLQF